MKTIDQEIAAKVHPKIIDMQNEGEKEINDYGVLAHRLPILIRTTSIHQALSYVESREREGEQRLLEDLADVVAKCDPNELANKTLNAQISKYAFLVRRTLIALQWYKRLSQSILGVQGTG